jgi:hypothetical protein
MGRPAAGAAGREVVPPVPARGSRLPSPQGEVLVADAPAVG